MSRLPASSDFSQSKMSRRDELLDQGQDFCQLAASTVASTKGLVCMGCPSWAATLDFRVVPALPGQTRPAGDRCGRQFRCISGKRSWPCLMVLAEQLPLPGSKITFGTEWRINWMGLCAGCDLWSLSARRCFVYGHFVFESV
jgi:hypothetical protein